MTRLSWFIAPVALAVLAACESSSLSSPGDVQLDRVAAQAQTCSITLPAVAHRPLPAVREVARELNEAFENSSVSCGVIAGIATRFNQLVTALDQVDGEQNLDAACGISKGLAKQLAALVENGQLDPNVTHPPQATGNVVENMEFISSEFCRNARL